MKLLWKITLFALFVSLVLAADAEKPEKSDVGSKKDKNNEIKDALPEEEETESLKEDAIIDDEEEEEKKHQKVSGLFQKISQKLGKPLENIHNYLKPKPKPTITVTKTLTLEVTRQVTRHPYCLSSPKGQKPCVPYTPHKKPHHHGKSEALVEEDEELEDLREEGVYVESTASVKSPQDLTEKSLDESELMRSKRYIEFAGETPAIEEVKSGISEAEIQEDEAEKEVDESGRFLFRRAETRTLTSTMWVTKVQKVTDYRVTATLAAQNCYPSGLNIPRC